MEHHGSRPASKYTWDAAVPLYGTRTMEVPIREQDASEVAHGALSRRRTAHTALLDAQIGDQTDSLAPAPSTAPSPVAATVRERNVLRTRRMLVILGAWSSSEWHAWPTSLSVVTGSRTSYGQCSGVTSSATSKRATML